METNKKPPIKRDEELNEFFKTLESEFNDSIREIKKLIGDYLDQKQ